MKKIITATSLILITMLINGCASKFMEKRYSTGAIGCTSDEITVKDGKVDVFGFETWVATCKGKDYICSRERDESTNCKEVSK
jgi:hypothetical protein